MAPILSHGDYTVVLIRALSIELAAARVIVDRTHSTLLQPPTEHIVYMSGDLSSRNLVIAGLPSRVYGIISAAAIPMI